MKFNFASFRTEIGIGYFKDITFQLVFNCYVLKEASGKNRITFTGVIMLLNCHTAFSPRFGVLQPEELVDAALQSGYTQLALTDINTTSAIIDTYRLAQARQMHFVAGIDFRNGIQPHYIGLAKNNTGYFELNRHLSEHLHKNLPFPQRAPLFEQCVIIYPFSVYKGWELKPYEYIGIHSQELLRLPFSPYKHLASKMVVLQPFSFLSKKHLNMHRLLRSIDQNCLLSRLESSQQAGTHHTRMPFAQLMDDFEPYPQIVLNTQQVFEQCHISFEFEKFSNKNLRHYTDSVNNDLHLISKLCDEGLQYRFKTVTPAIQERIAKEIDIIGRMGFASYFLINWDIVKYARHKDYYYVGRGSGANSMVAYLLRITDVDPLELDLYFERFINPYRSNPPDFDIDFSWTDRDDITRYIFNRYGEERTALVGTYNTFQHDATIRELGKVFGLPPAEIDRLQDKKNTDIKDELGQLVLNYSQLIKGLPNHLSIHASGILISHDPIHQYTATFMPQKGYATTQFSMLEAEDIGLYKFDILSQRGLSKIKDTLYLIPPEEREQIDLHDLNRLKNDEKVQEHLRKGDCIGCFYIESPAMRMLLAKLQANDYLRLVAASSIIRPGVSKSGMMREYILRYRDLNRREQARRALPPFYDLLAETYGVMVYQEDVIKVAHYFAGLSLAEADYLRRGMSWKFKQRDEFFKVRENFFNNCLRKGYDLQLVTDIWNQIESFANFAFSKGHSASYAVESYQALFLKSYYPLPYMVATLNNGGGFYRIESYINEARKHGARVLPPCVNQSTALSTLNGNTIYLGLGMVQNLERHTIDELVKERERHGPYLHFQDFIKRVTVSLEQVSLLIRVGAFGFSKHGKKELMWEAHLSMNHQRSVKLPELFVSEPETFTIPRLTYSETDDAFDEMELLGFCLGSPFELVEQRPDVMLKAHELKPYAGKVISIIGYLINVKSTYTRQQDKQEKMYFGTFVDELGQWIDTVHFPAAAKQYPFKGTGCYLIKGLVTEEFDYISITVNELHHLPVKGRYD